MKNYVQQNTVAIKDIGPAAADDSDLKEIGAAIGQARIVMLGEQDHGDAPTFLAKTRLIKYLHEKMGFNVLAFESDFFGLNYTWDFVRDGRQPVDTFIKKNISTMWTLCMTCQDLFRQYIPATQRTNTPLALTGFDNNMSTVFLYPILDSVLRAWQLPITQSPAYKAEIRPLLTDWYKLTTDTISNKKVRDYLAQIKEQLLTKVPASDFWVMTVDNLIQENIEFNNWKKDHFKDMNTRDRQMGLNLQWLSRVKYPREKIIVWAHNYHISKYSGHFPEDFMNKPQTMGTVFTADSSLAKETYILGFTSYEGKAGRLSNEKQQYTVKQPGSKALESWIDKKYDYAFLDFKKFNTLHPAFNEMFYMSGSLKGNMFHTSSEAQWNKVFDGIFFIRNMYPCEAVK